jgi:uncharacterized membrane protein YphA (DoxX/SURF4 family)
MIARLWQTLTAPAAGDRPTDCANLLLRLGYGGMVFVVHGLHKAEGGLAYFRSGAEWPLLGEVEGMGTPFPVPAAVAATVTQLVMPVFLMLGLLTRPAGLALAATLGGALAQNLTAGRDPQLALLYLLVAVTLGVWGGGRYSLDHRRETHASHDR